MYDKHRETITMSCGLYSSVFSAAYGRHRASADEAEIQTNLICALTKKEVEGMILVRTVAFQIANIALRLATRLPPARQEEFYACFFGPPKEKGAGYTSSRKTWSWIIKMAMSSDTTKTNKFPVVLYDPDQGDPMDDEGEVENPNCFVAYDGDLRVLSLVSMMNSIPIVRNILLAARRQWFSSYQTNNTPIPKLPSSSYHEEMISEIARDLDTAFRVNVTQHFVSRSKEYLRVQLANFAEWPRSWPKGPGLLNFLVQKANGQTTYAQEQATFQGVKHQTRKAIEALVSKTRQNVIADDRNEVLAADVKESLKRKATSPDTWPDASEGFLEYLFAELWGLTVDMDPEGVSFLNLYEVQEAAKMVNNSPPSVKHEIQAFVQAQRVELNNVYNGHKKIPSSKEVNPALDEYIDIYECLNIKTTKSQEQLARSSF